jgi:hypothetical protein
MTEIFNLSCSFYGSHLFVSKMGAKERSNHWVGRGSMQSYPLEIQVRGPLDSRKWPIGIIFLKGIKTLIVRVIR